MRHFVFIHRVVRNALLVTLLGALTACGFSTIQPDSSGDNRNSVVYNDETSEASTKREVGDPVSEGDVIVVDDAPAVTDGETFLGWESNEGELMQPGETYTVGEDAPEFRAVRHPNEAVEIVLSNVRAGIQTGNPGFALDIDQLTVAVGASYTDVAGQASGSVDLLSWDGSNWLHEIRLTVGDVQRTPGLDLFGNSLDLDANRLIVGAPLSNNTSGAAYLFEKQGAVWEHVNTFVSPSPTQNGLFGADVALSGDRVFVVESPANTKAEVHVYEQGAAGTWKLTQSFEHSNNPGDHRIDEVAADDNTLVFIGQPDTGIPPNGVSVKSWDGSAWQTETIAIPSGAQPESIDLKDNRLVVGVPDKYCALVFDRGSNGTWSAANPDLMTCDDQTSHPTAGVAVATTDSMVAVGDYVANTSRGEVLGFRDTGAGWSSVEIQGDSDGGQAGYTLAMNEHLLVTGRRVMGGSTDTVVATVQPTAALFD